MNGLIITPETTTIAKDSSYIHARLERLFFSSMGDTIGFPNDGSKIMNYFWEPADGITAKAILTEVKRLVSTYEPDIILESITSGFWPVLASNEVQLIIEIRFYLKDSPQETITETLSRVRTN